MKTLHHWGESVCKMLTENKQFLQAHVWENRDREEVAQSKSVHSCTLPGKGHGEICCGNVKQTCWRRRSLLVPMHCGVTMAKKLDQVGPHSVFMYEHASKSSIDWVVSGKSILQKLANNATLTNWTFAKQKGLFVHYSSWGKQIICLIMTIESAGLQ